MIKLKDIILDPLQGKTKLWIVYWIYGVLGGMIIPSGIISLLLLLSVSFLTVMLSITVMLGYATYMLYSVYQCMDNCKEKFWGAVAVVVSALGYFFVLKEAWEISFLFVELML